MKVRKGLIFFLGMIIFILTAVYSVRISSADNIYSKKMGYENKFVLRDAMIFQSPDENEETNSLILPDIDTYVYSIKFNAGFDSDEQIRIYYTESPDEGFSEEKSFLTSYKTVNGRPVIITDRYVYSVKADLGNINTEKLSAAELNDLSPVFDIEKFLSYCVFPTVLFVIILSVLLYGNIFGIYFTVFGKYIPLLKNLVSRDLKVKYRRSVLGFLWSVLNPLLMALIVNAVFSHLFRFKVEYFIIYYLLGSVLFNFMTECTTGSMMSVIYAGGLIKKVYIPKYIFPMQKCIFAFINMLFSITAVVFMIIITGMPVTPTAVLFPVPLVYTAVFALGLGLILSSLTVFFRDVEHLYTVFVSAWIYLTPVIYPESILTDDLRILMKLNPMYYYVTYFRDLVMYGTIPGAGFNFACLAWALLFLLLGMTVFKKCQDRFILYI